MTTIHQLVGSIPAEKMQVQILSNGERTLTLKGKGANAYTQVVFSSAPDAMHKEALIIWVDRKVLDAAIEDQRTSAASGRSKQQPAIRVANGKIIDFNPNYRGDVTNGEFYGDPVTPELIYAVRELVRHCRKIGHPMVSTDTRDTVEAMQVALAKVEESMGAIT